MYLSILRFEELFLHFGADTARKVFRSGVIKGSM
jgi:hypothetical protein